MAKLVIDDVYLQAAVVLFRTLEDLLSNHACTLIVGPSSCGKTALWKLLLRSLQKAYMDANTDVALIPDDVLKAVHVRLPRPYREPDMPLHDLLHTSRCNFCGFAGAHQFSL